MIVAGEDLLRDLFFSIGEKRGLSPEILAEVFDFLMENQFVPAGDRSHIRRSLEVMIKRSVKGD